MAIIELLELRSNMSRLKHRILKTRRRLIEVRSRALQREKQMMQGDVRLSGIKQWNGHLINQLITQN